MATNGSINANSLAPSVSFHRQTFGQNIHIEDNGTKATRHTSFDNGITFTSKPIKIDEYVCMKIIDIDETGQWLGSLAIGFTQINPDSVPQEQLCKSALPNLCQKTGTSYIKRIFEKLSRHIIITFYYNRDGAFYILDGKEQELCKNVDISKPLWGVIDIYGNVKGVVFAPPPQIVDNSRAFFTKYNQKPDKLPIKYFTNLNSADVQHIGFHELHGPELDLFCQNVVAFRKNVKKLLRPYLFIDFPMTPGDEFYIRILAIDPNYRTPGILGFTNANRSVFTTDFEKLPSGDPMNLYDRSEFWILSEDAYDERLSELDEYRIVFEKNGDIKMWRNNQSNVPPKTVACADANLRFYPFFFLNGRITALSLIGIISSTRLVQIHSQKKEKKDDEEGLCQLCYDEKANCVIVPCGHVFFCSTCQPSFEKDGKKLCPLCRKEYESVFEIADD